MTGAEYVESMRKRIRAAKAECSYDGNGGLYRVLLGDLSQASPLSAIFVYYPVNRHKFWAERLRDLQQDNEHLSLHVIPGANDPGFIIRGTVGPSWVNDNLWKTTPPDAIIALDLKPYRLRWFDADDQGIGPMLAKDQTTARDVKSHFKGSRDGNARARLIFRPQVTARTFYLFCRFGRNRKDLINRLCADERLPLRDLFEIMDLDESHHQFSDGSIHKRFDGHPQEDTERKLFIEEAHAIAVVELDPTKVQLSPQAERGPYQDLVTWCQAYGRESDDQVAINMILPTETVYEAVEFADPHRAWSEKLHAVVKDDERVSVGWLPTHPTLPPPEEKPAFEMARLPTVVVGCSESGKSWIAIHLLAQYARDGFTVIYFNYLEAKPSDAPRTECLRPYGAFVSQATGGRTKVKAVPWPELAKLIREDRKNDPSPPPERSGDFRIRPGRAYYTEFWLGHGTFEQLFGELSDQKGIVFCFDEVVNQAGDSSVKKTIEILQNKGRHDHHYSILIHQKLGDVQNKGWVDINGKCSLLLKKLEDEESRTLYQNLRVDADADFWGYDVDVNKLDQFFQASDFAIVRPFMADTKLKPIPLRMPAYSLPTNDTPLNWGDEVGS